jgi:hypothetical protein
VSKINRASASEGSVAQTHAKLTQSLQLHSYAGVDDAYTVPPASADVYAGQSGEKCSTDLIDIGTDAVQTYSDDEPAPVSPDKDAVVKVDPFQNTPRERLPQGRARCPRLVGRQPLVPAGARAAGELSATFRCRDACSRRAADPGIAIVGLDRRHDRFGRLGARWRRYWLAHELDRAAGATAAIA